MSTPVVRAIYAIPEEQLEALAIWDTVQNYLSDGFEPVRQSELERSLAEMDKDVRDGADVDHGRALDWKITLGGVMITVRHVVDGFPVTKIELAHAIEHGLAAKKWREERFHHDRYNIQRARLIDVLARLMMERADDDWLDYLLKKPNGPLILAPSLGERLANLIKAKGYSKSGFAREVGHERGTVDRWVRNKTVPRRPDQRKITELLGTDLFT